MSATFTTSRVSFLRSRMKFLPSGPETTKFVCGLTKTEAEEWLDWLESNGHRSFELSLSENGFAVWFN